MSIEISRDGKSGSWSLSLKRNVFVALGLLFVTSGLATFSGPWWQGIMVAVLEKADIVVDDSYQWLLGIIQVLVGLLFVGYKHFILDKHSSRTSIDGNTISKCGLKTESVREYFDSLVDDHSYKSSLDSVFHKSYTLYMKPENMFQVPRTSDLYKRYSELASDLHMFVAQNFYVFPNGRPSDGDYRYCLAPHMNMDREMIEYDPQKVTEYSELSGKLHEKVKSTRAAFDQFVEHLKRLSCL